MPTRVPLIKGSARAIKFQFLNTSDVAEDLTGITAATLAIKESETDEAAIMSVEANIEEDLDLALGTVTFSLTSENTEAFGEAGIYIGDILLVINGVSYNTDKMYFEVTLPITTGA